MATAAEKKKAAEAKAADEAASAVAVENTPESADVAEEAADAAPVEAADEAPAADEAGPSDSVDPRPSIEDAPPVDTSESEVAKQGAVKGVGQAIAAAPLEARKEPENVYESHSDANVPTGTDAVVAAYAERNDGSYLAAEDGDPIDPEQLFLGPDPSGQYIAGVRIVEHSSVEPYGHQVTTLVVAAGVPVSAENMRSIKARLESQA